MNFDFKNPDYCSIFENRLKVLKKIRGKDKKIRDSFFAGIKT
jgi:hypothetical protein